LTQRKLVITGGAGYIGSVLTREALSRGYEVHVVDRFFFGDQGLDKLGAILHKEDTRTMPADILDGTYAVLDLAAISNDPAGDLNPTTTMDINFRARRRLQELCLQKGVERYVLASSCSVYGFQDGIVNEDSEVNPLTVYAEANIKAEQSAFSLRNEGTVFTALRQATVFGLSPRMRFDLVVNAMALNVSRGLDLRILRDGEQWRPMIHVRDTSNAFLDAINQPHKSVDGQVFNTGADSQNHKILDLATRVSSALGSELKLEWYGDPDHRSYKVSFQKIQTQLGFKTEWDVERGAKEIALALRAGEVTDGPETRTLNWYQALSRTANALEDSGLSTGGPF
jgi:nucleoside-diphosphate-sugar epimerase